MNEDFHSQAWVDNRGRNGVSVGDLAREIFVAFERLAALHYAAPWLIERCRKRGGQRANADCL